MKRGNITIKDIAKRLKLSKSTVSRALRDHPHVGSKTRAAVIALAKELNYRPNHMAISLTQQKTYTIGIVIPRITFQFFSLAINSIQQVANKAGYQVIITQSNDSYETETQNIHTLISKQVDGLLISLSQQTQQYAHLQLLQTRNIPFVLFDRVCNPIKADKVIVDNYSAAFNAVSYLIQTGCKRIAHIGGLDAVLHSNQRLKGYLYALKSNNFPVDESLIIRGGFREDFGKQAAQQLIQLSQPPDAILAVTDSVAIGALKYLQSQGISVPEQISIIGFNNEPFADFVTPPLSSIALPVHEIGKVATRMLIKQLIDYENHTPKTKILKTKLILRESTRKMKEIDINNKLFAKLEQDM